MKHLNFRIMTIILFALSYLIATAQPPMHANKRMETLKKMKLLEVLDLNESESNQFLAKYDSWADKISDERKKLQNIREELADAVKGKDDNIKAISTKFENQLNQIHTIMKQRLEDFRKMLSDDNYAKLLIFEMEFPRKLQDEIMNRSRGRMRR
jgi:predicted  nucleic acid-binding Zn-ribbon protein